MRGRLDVTLYLVTDTAMCGELGVPATVRAAVAAGVTAVQLRDPTASDTELVAVGRGLVATLAGTGVPLLINNRVDLVDAIGAHGAHVGQDDLDVADARTLLGPGAHLGLSVQTVDQVERAQCAGGGSIDYLGVGPVWPQSTKPDAAAAVGLNGLAEIVDVSPWPCVAIGGVDADRVADVRGHGAAGIAVVSAICGQLDPAAAARRLRQAWEAS